MAGSYDDAPGRRMAIDDDGTVGLYAYTSGSGTIGELSDGNVATINSENESYVGFGGLSEPSRYLWFIFPELREVDGVFHVYNNGGAPGQYSTSGDTTNGRDGTWTQRSANLPDFTVCMGNYRDEITSLAVSNVRGVRVALAAGTALNFQRVTSHHIYGEISSGETPDRLLFIDEATGLEFTLPRDLGDIPRGGSEDLEWRIENNSATLTANTIQYTTEAVYLSADGWYTHTEPGGATFQATQSIASLAAATTTGLITTRRITPGNETPGLYAARTYLNVASWS